VKRLNCGNIYPETKEFERDHTKTEEKVNKSDMDREREGL